MRRASILPIALMAFAIVGFLFVLSYAITKDQKWPWSVNATKVTTTNTTTSTSENTNLSIGGNVNVTTNESTNTSPVYPETVKLFSSTDLGIQFYYNTAQPEETAVKQIGDTVYVYPSTYADPKNGQFVQVFTKDASDTLAQAITKRFLSGISTKDCFITPLALGDVNLTSTQSAAIIDWPSSLIDDNNPFGDNSKCPKAYQKTNGQRYFLTDSQAPTKLLFFSIGQYAITVDNVHTWQSTLRFISPTADWKTYENSTYRFAFRYPANWNVITNKLQTTVRQSLPGDKLEIGVMDGTSLRPGLRMHIDPTGWGTGSTYSTVSITRTSTGFTVGTVKPTGAQPGEFGLEDYYITRASETNNPALFYMDFFSTTKASVDPAFDLTVKNILESFTFTS